MKRCSLEGCDAIVYGFGYCRIHYRRFKKHGDPHKTITAGVVGNRLTPQTIEDRSIPVSECGCWLWLGAWNGFGYGTFWHRNAGMAAHRASWIAHFGAIPDGLMVCHKCDTPACVNPSHLFLGTAKDNAQDCWAKGRHPRISGEAIPWSRFTEEQIREIRAATGTQQSIADRYGVLQSYVSAIKRRAVWKHLDADQPERST